MHFALVLQDPTQTLSFHMEKKNDGSHGGLGSQAIMLAALTLFKEKKKSVIKVKYNFTLN